jgi:O-antigen ligase
MLVRTAARERHNLRWLLLVPPTLVVIEWLGRTMALGGRSRYALIGLAVLIVIARPVKILVDRWVGPGVFAIEVPILLMLVSTLVWRQRTATQLSDNPLDSAAQVRVICVSLALLLGAFALLSAPKEQATPRQRLTTGPFRVYLVYIGVVVIGAPISLKPFLTMYRAVELVAGCVVLLGAYRALGNAAARRIEATIYWFTVAIIASVWVGRVLWPARALERPEDLATPVKWSLVGVYPNLAANSLGALAALLAIWSLARFMNPRRYAGRRWAALLLTVVGVTTTIAAQYRTGYVAIVTAALVVFWLRQRTVFVLLIIATVFTIASSPSLVRTAEPYVLRGQTTKEAQQLSGRTDYWSHAIPVWEKSPVFGRGLWTASRYEVLEPLGLDTTAAVHSTWVEALVGTGIAGLSLLALCVLMTLGRAWRVARASSWAPIGPLALMVLLTVRSLTGNLFESFGHEQLVFLAIALAIEDRSVRRSVGLSPEVAGTGEAGTLAVSAS